MRVSGYEVAAVVISCERSELDAKKINTCSTRQTPFSSASFHYAPLHYVRREIKPTRHRARRTVLKFSS